MSSSDGSDPGTVVISLPITRPGSQVFRIATVVDPDLAAEIGWPTYLTSVDQSVRAADARHRNIGTATAALDQTIVFTQSYSEAAALLVNQPGLGVPVYSPHNGFWDWGPPPATATDAVVVGDYTDDDLTNIWSTCHLESAVTMPAGVHNDLTGLPIHSCTGLRKAWSTVWPQLRRIG